MGEGGSEFWPGKIGEKMRERKEEREARGRATEAVRLFASGEDQLPMATYSAQSQGEFDLRKLNPRAIFRLEMRDDQGFAIFTYFVLGDSEKRSGGRCRLYFVSYGGRKNDLPELERKDEYHLLPAKPEKQSFPVREAGTALSSDRSLGFYAGFQKNGSYSPVKIDLMAGGTAEKKPGKEKTKMIRLVPQMVPVIKD